MHCTQPDPRYRKVTEYRDQIPGHRANARPHPTTLIRWCTRGVRLPDGTRLRWRAVRTGTTWLTNDAWFEDFLAALTAAHVGPAGPPRCRTPGERSRASDAADAKLRELGF